MAPTIHVGTILMKDGAGMPKLGFETEPCFGEWSSVRALNGFALDRKLHDAGWNYFFMAAEIKVMFLGTLGAAKVQNALRRIVAKVKQQNFNSLEVTEIATRSFFGVPYVTVAAHSRHVQQSCNLDTPEARLIAQHDAEWATG